MKCPSCKALLRHVKRVELEHYTYDEYTCAPPCTVKELVKNIKPRKSLTRLKKLMQRREDRTKKKR